MYDVRVKAFLDRSIEVDWPYLWMEATYMKVRRADRIVLVAVIIAVGVDSDGRREALSMATAITKPRSSEPTSCAALPAAVCAA